MTSIIDKKNIDDIIVFTDGSCIKNTNSIKCGYGIYFPNNELANVSKKLKLLPLTNQRAELMAIYKCLKLIYINFIPKKT